ncbi:MAG TPA: asparagine--tRNA ligase [Candidatus Thermoplasmatota archaeon]|nr:asparagine--tRNA ligase [Candidatus Thermoplasmatota archaeon]
MTLAPVPIAAIRSGAFEGKPARVRGWVHRARSSGGIVFLVLRDATGLLQATVKKGAADDGSFAAAKDLQLEAAVDVEGVAHKDPRAPGGWELRTAALRVVGGSHEFPITEDQSVEFLLDKRHLWLRSRKLTNTFRVKAQMLKAFREWFDANAFYEVTPSVITTNACEGGSTLFEFDYFDQTAFLSQSSQMYLEALIFSLERVWCLAPSFRAEKSRTTKHLTEFWHLEAEEAHVDNEGNMRIQEELVAHVANAVGARCADELRELGRDPDDLLRIKPPFKRLHYDEAIDLLKKKGFPIEWGEDFGQPHERALVEGETQPIFVTHFPAEIKAFYMERDDSGEHALCADMIAPEGYGEIIGGSQRSLDVEAMRERLRKEGAPVEAYEWYFDLRRYGSVPHSGFGLGTERVLTWLCKNDHIRDATPFPRTINRAYP